MNKILITRPMPKAVEDRARSMGDVTFRKETTPMSATEMVSALHEFDVVLPTLGDQLMRRGYGCSLILESGTTTLTWSPQNQRGSWSQIRLAL